LGTGSIHPISEDYYSRNLGVDKRGLAVDGMGGSNLEENEKGEGNEKDGLEEVTLSRKLWARGPVQLENPYELTLQSSNIDSTALGIGFIHQVRIT
jgi:hypothetical protein